MASHEDRTEEEKTEEIKMLIDINFNSINDGIMAINQARESRDLPFRPKSGLMETVPESIKVRNWGINKYNDPIKEKRININIPTLGMILTRCITELHQQVHHSYIAGRLFTYFRF